MDLIGDIRSKVANNAFEFSKHAVDQAVRRSIDVSEIREAVSSGEVIEDYPSDKYGPTCLILGYTASGRALHLQCTHPSRPVIKLVTVYEPDPKLWIDCRVRRLT